MKKDPDAPLVLLEYLAVRKCHRLEGAAAANNHPAYRESLLRALDAAAAAVGPRKGRHAGIEGYDTSTSNSWSPRVLHWLQRILETLFLDSYRASRNGEGQGISSSSRGGDFVDDRHVLEAIRALGVNVQGGCGPAEAGGGAREELPPSRRAFRAWRVLLLRHVARSALGRPRRHRIRVSIRAIQVLQRFAASLVDPDTVRLWRGPGGCQISFLSSCGTFKANFFEFYEGFDDNEDETTDEMGVGKWIGAVIDCVPATPSQERSPVARRYLPELDDQVEDDNDGSTLGSISCPDNEENDDEDDDSTHYKRGSDQEMSTASMTSSLSTTSSRSSSSISSTGMGSTAPLLLTARGNRPLVSDDGADPVGAANGLIAPPPHRFRLTLPALLVATAKVARGSAMQQPRREALGPAPTMPPSRAGSYLDELCFTL